jgi:ATP-dependent helicase/nuclease subunit A
MDLVLPAVLNIQNFHAAFLSDGFMPKVLSCIPDIDLFVSAAASAAEAAPSSAQDAMAEFMTLPVSPFSFGYTYPFDAVRDIPSKRSVSSIKDSGEIDEKERREIVLSTPDTQVPSGTAYGTAFHTFMQHADFSHTHAADIRTQISSLTEKNLLSRADADALSISQLKQILSSDIIRRAQASKIVFREKTFSINLPSEKLGYASGESVLIQGAIDLCFLEDGGFVIVDYKTDHAPEEVVEKRLLGYRRQISLYAEAVHRLTGYPIKEKIIYMINHGIFSA